MNGGSLFAGILAATRKSHLSLSLFATLALALMTVPAAVAQTLVVVHDFNGEDGALPNRNMLFVPSPAITGESLLYGTTWNGGTYDQGTIFKITLSGQFTKLYEFTGNWWDGANPNGPLVRDTQGNLYGTTNGDSSFYCGTVFKLPPSGQLTLLWNFKDGLDGCQPLGPLAWGKDGNLYGTTTSGGPGFEHGYGTFFKVSPAGQFSVIYNFDYYNGAAPAGALAQDTDGNFYGTAALGGGQNFGTLYKLTPEGVYTVLHFFEGGNNDGSWPSGVVRDAAGTLYGTWNGSYWDYGGVYKLTAGGQYSALHIFTNSPDGNGPKPVVTLGANGTVYGSSESGGTDNQGTVFKITSQGLESVLYNFTGGLDGSTPGAGLTLTPSSSVRGATFYGTTQKGGSAGNGVIFRLTVQQ